MERSNNEPEYVTNYRINKNDLLINRKLSKFILKAIFIFLVLVVFNAYFIAISRNSNMNGNFQEFDVGSVTKSTSFGNIYVLFSK